MKSWGEEKVREVGKAIVIIVIFSVLLFAGTQQADYVHQYIVREAWKLAKYQVPDLEFTDLSEHIGNNETGNYPWETGLVVTGAYREDHEDPVYGYGGFDLFGAIDPIFVTMTHFWNADHGDNFKWNYLGSDWENHYQKARAYLYGDHSIFIFKKSWAVDYQQVILGRFIRYVDLFHFYNTGKFYNNGYISVDGDIHYRESSELTAMDTVTARKYAYEILGRLCHLLGDAGTPAHAHNDDHVFGDSYESYMKDSYSGWNYEDALRSGGIFFNIFQFDYPLRFLFYTTNQVADYFPSDDKAGDNAVTYFYDGDYYAELEEIISSLGEPPTAVNPSQIADVAFVYTIRATATLLYWFAVETGQIPRINQILSGDTTLTDDIEVSDGSAILVSTDAILNLNGHRIISDGGIVISNGAVIDPDIRLLSSNGMLIGLYPDVVSALGDALPGQVVELRKFDFGRDVYVASGKTLRVWSGATINLNGHVVKSTGGTIIVEFGADINPDIRLVCGSSVAFRGGVKKDLTKNCGGVN